MESNIAKIFHLPIEVVKASKLIKIGLILLIFPEPFITDFIGICLIVASLMWMKKVKTTNFREDTLHSRCMRIKEDT